jgi:hypothetical protein
LALALADREPDPRLVAAVHPNLASGTDTTARFPDPIGLLSIADSEYGGRRLASGRSNNEFAAALAVGTSRRVTIVDSADFLSGIALAAAVDVAAGHPRPVWQDPLTYLTTATAMGLVMAEDA